MPKRNGRPAPIEPDQVHGLLTQRSRHALDSEKIVLGSMLGDPKVIGDAIEILTGPDDFYSAAHSAIYSAIIRVYDEHGPDAVDIASIAQRLADRDILASLGGENYLIELVEGPAGYGHVPTHARIVADKALERRLVDASSRTIVDVHESADDIGAKIDRAEAAIFSISQGRRDAKTSVGIAAAIEKAMNAGDDKGLPTGFYELDDMMNGMHRGEMIILAARPSQGKTALALNILEHIGLNAKRPVGMFSLEMSDEQIGRRMMCAAAHVSAERLRRNLLSVAEFGQLQQTVDQLKASPIQLDDSGGLRAMEFRSKARRMVQQHKVQAIIIDYLQLMTSPGEENRQQEVSVISRTIKETARELEIPILALSQLNRANESRGHVTSPSDIIKLRPRMSDLRESGSLEQDADVILLLHRDDYYGKTMLEDYQPTGEAVVIVAKQRNGPTGEVKLQWMPESTRFNNLRLGP